MAKADTSFSMQPYACEPCSTRTNTLVRELVRMVPRAYILNGKLAIREYFCCPICFEAKFNLKGESVSLFDHEKNKLKLVKNG